MRGYVSMIDSQRERQREKKGCNRIDAFQSKILPFCSTSRGLKTSWLSKGDE